MGLKVLVVGGGAAGMMAAGVAAQQEAEVLLLEKNAQLGKKLLLTGKGRCNLTNDCEIEELIANFPDTGAFLYSAFYTFSNQRLRRFFAQLGVPTKVERGGRVFPESNSARQVVAALKKFLQDHQVKINLNTAVDKLLLAGNRIEGVQASSGKQYLADRVIFTPGGAAYPSTGSAGDGYRILEELGHTIQSVQPSLVPLEVQEGWVQKLQGLTLKNVEARLYLAEQLKGTEFGELLFTHFGLSGPIILTLSRQVEDLLAAQGLLTIEIDLKPALDHHKLDARLKRDFQKYSRKQFKNSLGDLLPSKLIPIIVELAVIPATKVVNQITKEERYSLVELLKSFSLTITGTRGFRKAIVTKGGVDTDEIDPATMESKLIKGLFLAGEVIDIDAYTGGYNLQAAFSTGYVAGSSVIN
ncbi:NAD(P)/FAD-dependent oxidoreductase [Fuchsiella alkaliacetigena]|uniref:NAD(P)/FAD-dependent oxidoreductase n=1 Tax=Fuchsiella alkaliacetigena TaxID=957042 RepID=UPI00200A658E|nr:NAD(P)/FAD-dependent oxidoreductase [Fuchsiella alkaliacetigena]MCK8823945.1 NAD(P)/FAD-dependent oxidoreductase [Fuchsiella alkaliacetigena]